VSEAAIDAIFADDFYPGSKRKRREVPESQKNRKDESWDANPIKKVRNGVETEFFLPGALAKALGKATVTIRLWERRGHIPVAPFRLPGYTDAKGVKHPGKRVYTRRLIDITVEEFAARDLLGAARVEWKFHEDLTIALLERWTETD
jgi:hypothetical protein